MREPNAKETLSMVAERGGDVPERRPGQDVPDDTDDGNADTSEVRRCDDVAGPCLMNRFAALRGSRFAGVSLVIHSGADMSCILAGACADLLKVGLDIPLRSEGLRLITAADGEIQVKGCAEREMVLLNEKRTTLLPMPIRVQAAVCEGIQRSLVSNVDLEHVWVRGRAHAKRPIASQVAVTLRL